MGEAAVRVCAVTGKVENPPKEFIEAARKLFEVYFPEAKGLWEEGANTGNGTYQDAKYNDNWCGFLVASILNVGIIT